MFCTKCGSKLPDGSVFCDQCGTMITEAQQQAGTPLPEQDQNINGGYQQTVSPTQNVNGGYQQMVPPTQPYNNGYQQNKTGTPGPKISNKIIGIGVAAVALIAVIILIVMNIKPRIKLNDYLTVSFDGYNTRGTATVSFDMESFREDYNKKIKYKGTMDDDVRRALKNGSTFCDLLFEECIDGELDKVNMLSSGETVTYTWLCNEELATSIYGVKLVYEDITFQVSDLTPVIEVDPFENVTVEYAGMAPYGYVTNINNNSNNEYLKNMYYYSNADGGLKNGDEVTIVASPNYDENYYLQEYGVAFTRLECTYTVEGLGSYVSSLEEISDDMISSMKTQAEDTLRAHAANRWDKEEILEGMEYLGCYLLTPKARDEYGSKNELVLVYKVSGSDNLTEYGVYDKFNYYYTTSFKDIVLLADGTLSVNLTDYTTPSDRFTREVKYGERSYEYRTYYYYGYETFETMFNKVVTTKIDRYNYETNVTQK